MLRLFYNQVRDDKPDQRKIEQLLAAIQHELVVTERQNQNRHAELIEAVSASRISNAEQRLLDSLLKRSEAIAKKLEQLDRQTP